MHFGAQAGDYAAARPPYPSALWDVIRTFGALQPGLRALDLGAGTGQATGPLIAAGLRVTAVEPGEHLAHHIRAAYPSATVLVARAEDVVFEAGSFDIAVAATSIHWMDLEVILPMLRSALTGDGVLLVWRNVFGDPQAERTPFRERVEHIVRERGAPSPSGLDPENAGAVAAALTAAGLFTVEGISTFRWSIELDEDQVRRLFSTFSDWSSSEANRAANAVRELGGTVREHYLSWLITLKPADAAR